MSAPSASDCNSFSTASIYFGFAAAIFLLKVPQGYKAYIGEGFTKRAILFYLIVNLLQVILYATNTYTGVGINTLSWGVWLALVLFREWTIGILLIHRFKAVNPDMPKYYYFFGFTNFFCTLAWFAVALLAPYGKTSAFNAVWDAAISSDVAISVITRLYMLISNFVFLYMIVNRITKYNRTVLWSNDSRMIYLNCFICILATVLDLYRTVLPKEANVGGLDFLARLNFDLYIVYFLDFGSIIGGLFKTAEATSMQDRKASHLSSIN